MLTPEYFSKFTRLLKAGCPDLSDEQAARVAAEVGDTPMLMDGEVVTWLDGKEFRFSETILRKALAPLSKRRKSPSLLERSQQVYMVNSLEKLRKVAEWIRKEAGVSSEEANEVANQMGASPDEDDDGFWTATLNGRTIKVRPMTEK
ncbi:MAG: hypothetical protein V4675_10005 [Verrucomicrobiota bacterium]